MRKIYKNGIIYTLNPIQPVVEAVVIENGRFIDLGDNESMLTFWKTSETEVVDLQGKAVTPGLTDSHLHLSMVADSFINLDLTGITSKNEMLEKIEKRAQTLNKGEWLVGANWDENLFHEGSIPNIQELDYVAPTNPILIHRVCRHAAVTNSAALKISNYHKDITVPEGGTIVLDETTKEPTGLLLESAKQLIAEHIPERSYQDWKNALRKAIKFSLQQGLTSVHTNDPLSLGGVAATYNLYDSLINEEGLGLRVNLLMNHDFLKEIKELGMYPGYGNNLVQLGAIKLFADGAFGRRTALLSKSYADDPENYGDAMFDQAGLKDIIQRARELNFPVAIHAIGDQALENALNALDEFPTTTYRDRLIHVPLVDNNLLSRLAKTTRIADIQPRFLASDFPWVSDRLGPERTKRSYAWKTMLEHGVRCAAGSDAPVEPVNPLLGIHAAVTRKTPGDTHEGYNPSEKLELEEAFRLFTEYAAYATNEETIKGTISRGKLADMTVYSTDPFKLNNPDELLNLSIEKTITDGVIQWDRESEHLN
jgi:hypothetical protein